MLASSGVTGEGIDELWEVIEEHRRLLESSGELATLRAEQDRLTGRRQRFAGMRDGLEVWAALGVPDPRQIPIMDRDSLVALRKGLPA